MEKSNKSLLWEYFEKLPDGSGRCKTCKKQIACTSRYNWPGTPSYILPWQSEQGSDLSFWNLDIFNFEIFRSWKRKKVREMELGFG